MSNEVAVTGLILRAFEAMLWITLVPLSVLMVVGIVLSLLFSILQINDQSLPIAAKIITIVVVLVSIGSWMSAVVLDLSHEVLREIARI